jgi:tRNA pseudouridine(55) synthase
MALHLVYKKQGETPLQALERVRERDAVSENVSMTYAGRLDPLAEGVLLILSDKDVYRKEEFLSLPKTYEFEVLFGVATDTQDVLGIVSPNIIPNDSVSSKVFDLLTNFIGTFNWEYPEFSSKTVDGKPLFQHARQKNDISIPKREMTINTLDVLGMKVISLEDLESKIFDMIDSVSGDFRQEEIITSWKKCFTLYGNKHFSVVTFRAEVKSGTYIRILAKKMAESLQLPGMALSITRTKVGSMSVS